MEKERKIITELIGLYRDLPCLWDLTSEAYKDTIQKQNAWDILASKLREIDPAANVASAKKKIDNLKISYLREFKKVKESKKRTGSATSGIHKPCLWYYDLMTFLKKKNDHKIGMGSRTSTKDEDDPLFGGKKRKQKTTKERNLNIKKERLNYPAPSHNILRTNRELNPFGVYVGKKIEEILPGRQRDIAEKLISDVLFLAKSNQLTFETKIEIPSSHHSLPYSTTQYSPVNQYFVPSPQQCTSSSESSSNGYQIHFQSPPSPSSHKEHNP